MLESAFQGKPQWYRQYLSVALLACASSVFLYWNPAVRALFHPLHYALFTLIAPMAIYSLAFASLQLIANLLLWNSTEDPTPQTTEALTDNGISLDLDGDDIDLDAGRNTIAHEQRGRAIANLLSPDASLDNSINNVMILLGEGTDEPTAQATIPMLLVQLMCIGLAVLPPLVQSYRLMM